jgi:hypothetical protein
MNEYYFLRTVNDRATETIGITARTEQEALNRLLALTKADIHATTVSISLLSVGPPPKPSFVESLKPGDFGATSRTGGREVCHIRKAFTNSKKTTSI